MLFSGQHFMCFSQFVVSPSVNDVQLMPQRTSDQSSSQVIRHVDLTTKIDHNLKRKSQNLFEPQMEQGAWNKIEENTPNGCVMNEAENKFEFLSTDHKLSSDLKVKNTVRTELLSQSDKILIKPMPKSSTLQGVQQSTTKFENKCAFESDLKNYLSCPSCPRIFSCTSEVQEHIRSIHSYQKKYECDICNKVYSVRHRLNTHRQTHNTERPFKCDSCNKTFKLRGQLNEHMRIHTGAKRHFCDSCDYATSNKTVLQYHKNRLHNLGLDYVCEHCGRKFPSPQELKNHLDIHREKTFKCQDCGKYFTTEIKLNHHQKTHNPDREKFQCEICCTLLSYKTGLRKHILSHSGGTRYTCEFCGKNVSSAETLDDHRRIHTGEKPFSCDVCNKAFNSKKYLVIHKRIHTGEKPFMCSECGKAFSQRGTLTIHMRLHMGVKPYECGICSRAFVTRTLLSAHEKTVHEKSAH